MQCTDPTLPTYWNTHQIHSAPVCTVGDVVHSAPVCTVGDAVHRPHFAHILKHTSDTQCTSLYCRWCGAQTPLCPHTATHNRYTMHQSVLLVTRCTDPILPKYGNTHQIHSAPVCTVGDAVHRPHFAHILKHTSQLFFIGQNSVILCQTDTNGARVKQIREITPIH